MNDLSKVKSFLEDNISEVFKKLNMECSNSEPLICKCPIHNGDNERSFSYYHKSKKWVCWTHGCQNEYGNDVFGLIKGFLSKDKEANFYDVIKWVKKEFNISSKITSNNTQKKIDFISQINKINENTTFDNCDIDKTIKDVKIPSDYFVKKRLYNPDTMRFFGVGDSLLKYGISRLRSIIPIHNDDGSIVISNLYRSTVDWLEPKFLIEKNFKKGDYLYNYHRASNVAKQSNTIFLVEGSGDVWRMYEAGVLNCVSIMGKDISLNQRIKLDKLCVLNIVVLLDSDESGRESKVNLMRDLSRFYNLIFPRFSYKKDIGKMNPIDIKNNILFNLKGKY